MKEDNLCMISTLAEQPITTHTGMRSWSESPNQSRSTHHTHMHTHKHVQHTQHFPTKASQRPTCCLNCSSSCFAASLSCSLSPVHLATRGVSWPQPLGNGLNRLPDSSSVWGGARGSVTLPGADRETSTSSCRRCRKVQGFETGLLASTE